MVPAARAAPSAPVRVPALHGARGVPLTEPTIRVVTSSERGTGTPRTPGVLREVAFDGRDPDATVYAFRPAAPAIEHMGAE